MACKSGQQLTQDTFAQCYVCGCNLAWMHRKLIFQIFFFRAFLFPCQHFGEIYSICAGYILSQRSNAMKNTFFWSFLSLATHRMRHANKSCVVFTALPLQKLGSNRLFRFSSCRDVTNMGKRPQIQ